MTAFASLIDLAPIGFHMRSAPTSESRPMNDSRLLEISPLGPTTKH